MVVSFMLSGVASDLHQWMFGSCWSSGDLRAILRVESPDNTDLISVGEMAPGHGIMESTNGTITTLTYRQLVHQIHLTTPQALAQYVGSVFASYMKGVIV